MIHITDMDVNLQGMKTRERRVHCTKRVYKREGTVTEKNGSELNFLKVNWNDGGDLWYLKRRKKHFNKTPHQSKILDVN